MKNLNLLFNKTYYEKLGEGKEFENSIIKHNEEIFNTTFIHSRDYIEPLLQIEGTQTFVLKTTYPGLLIGTGSPHGSQKNDNDINLGFSFEYVTGQPFIPGSSIKGVLRSHFKERSDAVKEIIEKELKKIDIDIAALENEIFDGKDIFLDGVVYDSDENCKILGSDYITPHLSVTKNPIPILLVKVLPNVRFEFRFVFKDGIISKEEKTTLFSILLCIFGLGAKTNVGYGRMVETDRVITAKNSVQDTTRAYSSNSRPKKVSDSSDRVICPHCGASNHQKYPDGNLRKKCYKCHEYLYLRR